MGLLLGGLSAGVGLTVWGLVKKIVPGPLTLACPNSIDLHEYVLSGTHASRKEGLVLLYVQPDDGFHEFYRQQQCQSDSGTWNCRARFGNPYGRGHRRWDPGLPFTVIAAFVPALRDAERLPSGTIKKLPSDLMDELASKGAAVASCRIDRRPERCQVVPQLKNPLPPTDPSRNAQVRCTPCNGNASACEVEVDWLPAKPMFVELRDGKANEVENYHGKELEAGTKLCLSTGTYELKLKEKNGSWCSSDVWFDVVRPDASGDVSHGSSQSSQTECDDLSASIFPALGCAEVIKNPAQGSMTYDAIPCNQNCLPGATKAVRISSILERSGFGVLLFKKRAQSKPLDASSLLARLRIVQGSRKFEAAAKDQNSRVAYLHCEAPTLGDAYDYGFRFPIQELETAGCRMVPQDTVQVSVGFSAGSGSGAGEHIMEVLGLGFWDRRSPARPIQCQLAPCSPKRQVLAGP